MVEYWGYVILFMFRPSQREVMYLGPFDWTCSRFARNYAIPLTFQGDTL